MRTLLMVLAVGLLLAADDANKDQEKLQGDWTLQSGERDGNPFPDEIVKSLKRNITGNKFTITRDDQPLAKGTFTLDPAKKPKAIDIKLEGTESAVHGIYEVEGDAFKLCYAAPGEARPKEFAAPAGSGFTMAVWKRAKK